MLGHSKWISEERPWGLRIEPRECQRRPGRRRIPRAHKLRESRVRAQSVRSTQFVGFKAPLEKELSNGIPDAVRWP